jgi:uncharacterized cupin superfamily protein
MNSAARYLPQPAPVLCACLALSGCRRQRAAADSVHTVKMSKDRSPGSRGLRAPGQHHGNTTHDVEVFRTASGLFDAGMYRSGKVRAEITEPYGVHEYMHFLEGGVTLTSSDGTVTEVRAGDSVVIPAEWTGVWDTEGYTKIYVIYSPDKPIP